MAQHSPHLLVVPSLGKSFDFAVSRTAHRRLRWRLNSEQRIEPRRLEMPVVTEDIGDTQSPHHHKRNMIDDPCTSSLTTSEVYPRGFPIAFGGNDQVSRILQALP